MAQDPVRLGEVGGEELWLCPPRGRTYRRVIDFAAARYDLDAAELVCPEDTYSDIFVLRRAGEMVATVSVTRRAVGPIEAEAFYPREVLEAFGPRIATFYRLAARHGEAGHGLRAMRAAGRHVIRAGVRLALISAKPALARWYVRLGFRAFADADYVHPRLAKPHTPLYCPFDPAGRSAFEDLFVGIADPLTAHDVEAVLARGQGGAA